LLAFPRGKYSEVGFSNIRIALDRHLCADQNVGRERCAVVKVELYTTTYCPFCTRAKNLLKRKGVAFEEIDVTEDEELRAKMIEMSGGRRTVPEIFINGKIVGGFDELKALDDQGKLDVLLAESAPA
jgi:glutaredoxin 3